MALADTFSTPTYGSWTTPTYGLISRNGLETIRLEPTIGFSLKISHSNPLDVGKPQRHYMQLAWPQNVVSPITGLTKREVLSCSISVVVPSAGWSQSNVVAVLTELLAIIQDSDVTPTAFVNWAS